MHRLLALCALIPLAAGAQTLPPLLQAEGALNPDWRFVGFPKKKADLPATQFDAGKADEQSALRVLTASSYGGLVHDMDNVPPARLRWRWRLDQPLSGGKTAPDLTTKAGDDAALKVCVMFNHPLERVPFVERTLLRLARSVSGEPLPAATLCYVWDSGHVAGLQGANPYSRRMRYISLRGSETPTGQWVAENRDLAQDFVALFADELPQGAQTPPAELPKVNTVLIGADGDNTASNSLGWVSDLHWGATGP
ncbi:DUF3047 domain-containing protein [Hydrogenophaga sp. A37]|uniref:DUF3047 domain-containing protein n=1 Tax=Hydrogenophaga sp. A37 TaxID=1945864 RepID=UPI0009879F2C|nr:DUF3047 domain-containing protein [Hydrogenophaga sp. A37]OOG87854.1 hypothetical protein B0E41_03325 [Hydrogenophaga sp. A37]